MNETDPANNQPHRRPNYLLVFLALAILTAAEVAIVTFFPSIPKAPLLLAMSLAKAMLVIFYFMHLRFDNRWYALIFFAPFFLVIPILITLQIK